MNDDQRRRLERLERGRSFGEARTADFPPTSKGGLALNSIATLINEIVALDA
jgi:hypothetical protein